eukprot:CAMPEP_0182811190 /NCGR_PEP_ID=MMETSP0006_2-20121128/8136_1 /TAXON_ID=97485 /ORGANISM="Prymnesium parvum, Strain Texoma1" /LENGTH=141 /DNA_ID=CAMNT_0024937127 /DNA_START=742 /DNA_END=1163 /DNA_ORIENTATION=+
MPCTSSRTASAKLSRTCWTSYLHVSRTNLTSFSQAWRSDALTWSTSDWHNSLTACTSASHALRSACFTRSTSSWHRSRTLCTSCAHALASADKLDVARLGERIAQVGRFLRACVAEQNLQVLQLRLTRAPQRALHLTDLHL